MDLHKMRKEEDKKRKSIHGRERNRVKRRMRSGGTKVVREDGINKKRKEDSVYVLSD